MEKLAFWMYFIIFFFLAFSYSNVTHKIFYLAKIDARDKEKQSLGGGRKMHLFFYTW